MNQKKRIRIIKTIPQATSAQEPLDICLEKEFINKAEYRAGLFLRWLYTLRFGSPVISAYNPGEPKGRPIPKHSDDDWLSVMQRIYKELICELKESGVITSVTDICIYAIQPAFITNLGWPGTAQEFTNFKYGMDILTKAIESKKKRKK